MVAIDGDTTAGYYSLRWTARRNAGKPQIAFDFPRGDLADAARDVDGVQRLRDFTHGFYASPPS
jgi:hypothetical protein